MSSEIPGLQIEQIRQLLDKYKVSSTVGNSIERWLYRSPIDMYILEECFSFDVRRGIIASQFSALYECFPPETRSSDFLTLVDAFYEIDERQIRWAVYQLLFSKGMTDDERCHFVQGLLPRLTNAYVVRQFGVKLEDISRKQFYQIILPLLPGEHIRATAESLLRFRPEMYKEGDTLTLPIYTVPRTVVPVEDRRAGLLHLIERSEAESRRLQQEYAAQEYAIREASAVEDFAEPASSSSSSSFEEELRRVRAEKRRRYEEEQLNKKPRY